MTFQDGRLASVRLPDGDETGLKPAEIHWYLAQCYAQDRREADELAFSELAARADPGAGDVLSWLDEQVGAAPPVPCGSVPCADGRDASGGVHVSLTLDDVLALDLPEQWNTEHRAVESAICEAFNTALERLHGDALRFVGAVPQELEEPDWSRLQLDIEALRREP